LEQRIDCLSLDLSYRLGEVCRLSTEILRAATSKLGNSSSYFVCAIRTLIYRGRPETFLLPKKTQGLKGFIEWQRKEEHSSLTCFEGIMQVPWQCKYPAKVAFGMLDQLLT